MSKPRSHQLDIYGAWIHVATDRKAWRSLRRRLPSLDKDPGALGAFSITLHEAPSGKVTPHLSVWLDINACDDKTELVDTIAHEATHAAVALLDHIGQAYDSDNSEALAYLIGWISGWLWEACA